MKKQSEQEKFYGTLNGVVKFLKILFIFFLVLIGLSVIGAIIGMAAA